MSWFEAVFSLFALLLGLSIAELLTGLGKAIESRERIRLGWLTPILAAFVVLDLTYFWGAVWVARDAIPFTPYTPIAFTALAGSYYLAAYLVFPTEMSGELDLEPHYFKVRRYVFAVSLVAQIVQLAFWYSVPELRVDLADPKTIGEWTLLVVLLSAGILTSGKRTHLAILAVLIATYFV